MKQSTIWRGLGGQIEEAQRYSRPSDSGSKPSDPGRFGGEKSQHFSQQFRLIAPQPVSVDFAHLEEHAI
jgi:hypothetical protein